MAEHGHAQHRVNACVRDREGAAVGGDGQLLWMAFATHRQRLVLEVDGDERSDVGEPCAGGAGACADVQEGATGDEVRLQELTQERARRRIPPVRLLGVGHTPILRHLHGSRTS